MFPWSINETLSLLQGGNSRLLPLDWVEMGQRLQLLKSLNPLPWTEWLLTSSQSLTAARALLDAVLVVHLVVPTG